MINFLMRGRSFITQSMVKLFTNMGIVWMKHVWWTREVILAIVDQAPWTNNSVAKLLQNPIEMGQVFAPYFSEKSIKRLEELFTIHLKLGGDIVTAAKAGDSLKVDNLQKQWHKNADDIAKFFAGINPFYNEAEIRNMLYEHLRLTTDEAVLTLQGKYDEAIAVFDKIQDQALGMAQMFSMGIVREFPEKFR